VAVEAIPAAHSRLELKAQAEVLAEAMRADPASKVHMVQIPTDGSRVIALVDKVSSATVRSDGAATLRTSTAATARSVSLADPRLSRPPHARRHLYRL
jgi:hypothetical protein